MSMSHCDYLYKFIDKFNVKKSVKIFIEWWTKLHRRGYFPSSEKKTQRKLISEGVKNLEFIKI